ncbi:MAG: TIGR03746 family integrating conjugative element protein [Moritella sp.]|nr:TIGR03746 family integrating conjugative element protein [Moritella sp.]
MNALSDKDKHLRDSKIVMFVMLLVVFSLIAALASAPSRLRVYVPPVLTRGSEMYAGEVPKPTIYSLAYMIFQTLNTWDTDGAADGKKNLEDFRCYITEDFRGKLEDAHVQRLQRGEASGRVRYVSEAHDTGYDEYMVTLISAGKWHVQLDLKLNEYINSTLVKQATVRYPLVLVADDSTPGCNQWGIKIAGFYNTPHRIIIE